MAPKKKIVSTKRRTRTRIEDEVVNESGNRDRSPEKELEEEQLDHQNNDEEQLVDEEEVPIDNPELASNSRKNRKEKVDDSSTTTMLAMILKGQSARDKSEETIHLMDRLVSHVYMYFFDW